MKVLVAEDDRTSRYLLESFLMKWGFEVVVANDGSEAWRELRLTDAPRIAILDWMMPGMEGVEICRKIREHAAESYTYVILITAKGQKEDVLQGLEAGADDYLTKPFDPSQLRARLRAGTRILEANETLRAEIAERKRAEQALMQSEEHYRLLFEASPHPMWLYDSETRAFLAVNDAAVEHYGHSRQEFLAMRVDEIRAPDRPSGILDAIGRIPAAESLQPQKCRHRKKDGTIIDVEIRSHPILLAGKSAELVLADDVTDRKMLEEQFRQAQKMEAVGRLAGGVAHDFNNLLTVINGYSQITLDHLGSTDPLREKIAEIKKAGDRAAGLIRQLLAFSRQQVLAPRVLDLNAVVVGLEKMLRRLIGEDIELVTQAAPALGRVKADAGQIEQVIMNLVVNARDAMSKGGKLVLKTANSELDEDFARQHPPTLPGRYVMLAVSDTGCGMNAETRARIFEPFFTTKEPGKGTGLGLSTVYGIVKQSGGYVWVDSELGQGATFKVYLPRVEESVELTQQAKTGAPLPKGSETVLIVEDDASVRLLARQVLESNGYTVFEASQGEEALLFCKQHNGPINLLLTDAVMPQLSGPELAKQLVPLRPQMKMLFMSAYMDKATVQHDVLDAGMAFLQKPFTPDTLVRKVREVLDGS